MGGGTEVRGESVCVGCLYIPGKPARNVGPLESVGAANSHRNQARSSIEVFPLGEPREGDQEDRICQSPEARKQKVCFWSTDALWGQAEVAVWER